MPRILNGWPPMRMMASPPCMAGATKCSARTPSPCEKAIWLSRWKMARLLWSSWREKNEENSNGIGAADARHRADTGSDPVARGVDHPDHDRRPQQAGGRRLGTG